MDRLRTLIREPALIIDLVETLVVGLVAFGIGLSGDQQTYIVAAVVAVLGLIKACTVAPFAVNAVVDLGRAVLALLASFGVGLTADQIAILVTLLGTVTTLIATNRTTPIYDPVTNPSGAGAGPVTNRNEAGVATLGLAGVVILVLGLVLLLLALLHSVALGLVIPVILIALGLVLIAVDRRGPYV